MRRKREKLQVAELSEFRARLFMNRVPFPACSDFRARILKTVPRQTVFRPQILIHISHGLLFFCPASFQKAITISPQWNQYVRSRALCVSVPDTMMGFSITIKQDCLIYLSEVIFVFPLFSVNASPSLLFGGIHSVGSIRWEPFTVAGSGDCQSLLHRPEKKPIGDPGIHSQ